MPPQSITPLLNFSQFTPSSPYFSIAYLDVEYMTSFFVFLALKQRIYALKSVLMTRLKIYFFELLFIPNLLSHSLAVAKRLDLCNNVNFCCLYLLNGFNPICLIHEFTEDLEILYLLFDKL